MATRILRSVRCGAALMVGLLVTKGSGQEGTPKPSAEPSPLAERRPVLVDGRPLVLRAHAAFPALGDIDGDGRDDLLIGDPEGSLHVYRSVGEEGKSRFAPAEPFGNYCDDERIPVG